MTYDLSNDPYDSRVVQVLVFCTVCDYPEYVPLDPEAKYRFVVPSFMADGYDGYDVIAENGENRVTGRYMYWM